jgi:hypothetical protein
MGLVLMTRCPIGALDERITENGGIIVAEQLANPWSERVLAVSST